jgi:cell division protein FtsN
MNPSTPLESADNVDDTKSKAHAVPVPPATSATTRDVPDFGWSAYAERVNGRFAMLGFSAVLLIETLSRDSFLHWAGLVP